MSRSIVFDTQLLELGSWDWETKKQIEDWVCEDGFDEKRGEAANLINELVR